jgi:hypothetical protein
MDELEERLMALAKTARFIGNKGPLAIALVVTDHARKSGLPLKADELVTDAGTQVLGAGRDATQRVLARFGETRTLAAEGGRTSRGSVGNMRAYVEVLNQLHAKGLADIDKIERFWIERVREFFAGKPFKLKMDASQGLRSVVRAVIEQAKERQRRATGTQYTGAVMQHLVGAKLSCALPNVAITHNSSSTSDQQSGRGGDFEIGDVAVHVTTSPSEALIKRCRDNIGNGIRPIIVTVSDKVDFSGTLAEQEGIGAQIDVFDIEQFIALNVYELGGFTAKGNRNAVGDIIEKYNEIIDTYETDPSLKIDDQ